MGNLAAFQLGVNLHQQAKQDKRQATQDAWTEEQRGRTRADQSRTDKAWEQMDAQAQDQQFARDFDAAGELGVTPSATPAASPSTPAELPVREDVGANYGSGSVGSPEPAAAAAQKPSGGAAPQTYAQQQRAILENQLAMARASRDQPGFQAAHKALFSLKVGEDSAKIGDFVQSADDAQYKELLSKVTADKQNKYEASFDPATGLTTLKLGSAKKEFTRAEMGQYFAAKHKLKNGDPSAMAELEALDHGLAKSVAEDLKQLNTNAKTANDAALKTAVLDVREKGIEARERVGMAGVDARLNGKGGVGSGSRRGGGAEDVYKLSNEAWELANKGEAKLDPPSLLKGARLTQELVVNGHGKVSPALAAEVALTVTTDPKVVEPAMDLQTGDVDGVYEHPTHGSFKIGAKVASAADAGKFTPEQMQGMTARFLSKMPAADQTSLVSAAFDPKARAALMTSIDAEIDKSAAASIKANPQQAEALKAQAESTKQATAQSLRKKLDLVMKYGKPPSSREDEARQQKRDYGLGNYTPRPGTPPELASRMQTTQQAAEREATKALTKSAAGTAKIKADAAKNKEADWMTLPAISKMRPNEARQYLRDYPTLDRTLRDALSQQMQSEELYQLPDYANVFR